MDNDIFQYVKNQITAYQQAIPLTDAWDWSMKEHVRLSFLYINSQLSTGKDDFKPVKNITRPILNLQHRTEDIEVKDVQIYVDDPDNYHLSFLVRKYHDDVFSKENDLDSFLDDLGISRIDYGAGLSKQLDRPCPEVVPLQSIAFCDQTDLLSGPLGIRHFYSPDQLLDMRQFGWGNPAKGATISLEDLITISTSEKKTDPDIQPTKTPGKYIEVFEVHGNLPKKFANPLDTSGEYETRIFIVAFYQKKDSTDKMGVILYTALETKSPFKLTKRDNVYGRALGFGGAEELFEPQVWVNYDMIRMQNMLDAASITILQTTDPTVANKNEVKDADNLSIIELAVGTTLGQVDTFPRNLTLFKESVANWETHAQQMGGATEAILGDNPSAGTPFKLQQQVIAQGLSLHDYRRGQYAKHIEEIYNDWIIPYIEKEICKGMTFLSELDLEELQYVMDAVVTNMANDRVKAMLLSGETPTPDGIELYKGLVRAEFKKRGSKHFIEILKNEFKGMKFKVKVSVKGKSKDLGAKVDNLVNVFRQVIANPAILQAPAMSALFNQIIEYSGLEPLDFSNFELPAGAQPPQTPQPAPQAAAQPQAAAGVA